MDVTVVLLLGLLVLLFMNYSGRRRAQRDRLALQQRLVPGAEVVTTSGLHGSVDLVDDDGTVLLEIAPGWVTRWEKAAVSRIVASPADAVGETSAEPGEPAEPAERPEPGALELAEPAEPPAATESPRPAGEPGTYPAPEPGARPLPDTAPPDRA